MHQLGPNPILSIRVSLRWNVEVIRNYILKLMKKLGLHHNVLAKPGNPTEKLTLTLVERQYLPDVEKIDP